MASKIYLPDGVTELANVKSVVFKEAVNSGVDLRPGCVGSASIEVEVYNTQPNAVSAGDALTYYQVDKNDNATLIGTFYAEPVIAARQSYKFVAYDAASKLNADFSAWLMANQSSFPMTIYALVSAACTVAGVTLGSSSWSLSTENVESFYADGITCRDVLSYAAELGCKFVRCHSDGHVYFDWYATASNKRIYPSAGSSGAETRYAYKQDGLQYANYTTAAIDGVAVHPSGEDDVAYIYPVSASGNLLNITNNLLLTGADASLYNAAAQAIYTALNTLGTYRPATAKLFPKENPFRAGDVVAVTDAQGVSFTTVIMEQIVNESDAVLSSTGNENYSDADGNTQKALVQLASDIVRVNKLKVNWADINTAIINYLTANNVTAQNLTIVDEYGNALATYDANGITLGDLAKGHAELDYHSFKLYDATGNLYVEFKDLRGADGKYEIVETFTIEQPTGFVQVEEDISSVVSVKRNNVVVPPSQYSFSSNVLVFQYALSVDDVIEVDYKTATKQTSYTLGTRKSGEAVGTDSFGVGSTQTASGNYSSAVGGSNNEASGVLSSAVGGHYNHAVGFGSVVVGGSGNNATGDYAVVAGGQNNTSSGVHSIVSGIFNEANHKNQFVFGEYNETDPSTAASTKRGNYVEIVGNGTADNARSNARTLDWSGNETLAGGLTTGGNVSVTGDVSASGDVGGATATISGNASVGGDLSVTGSVSLGSALPVASGGTGATNATVALENLGGLNLSLGRNIPNNSDLNDYTTPGTYYCANGTSAATLSNVPSGVSAGFKLVVYYKGSNAHINQELYPSGSDDFYIRYYQAGTWYVWKRVLDTDDLPLSVANGGTGATDAASALAALGGTPLVSVDNTANTSYTFSVANASRFILSTIASNADGKGLYIFNTTTTGSISRADVLAAGAVSFSTATRKLTVTSTRSGTFAFLVFTGSVSLDT